MLEQSPRSGAPTLDIQAKTGAPAVPGISRRLGALTVLGISTRLGALAALNISPAPTLRHFRHAHRYPTRAVLDVRSRGEV